MITYASFHGSPGIPNEFLQLQSQLGGNWSHQDRPNNTTPNVDSDIWIGYSWGCRELLSLLNSTSNSPKAVVLLAPFIYPHLDVVNKTLFKTPVLGKLLFDLVGPSAIEKGLLKSSDPALPSNYYREAQGEVFSYLRVKHATLEKKSSPFHFPSGDFQVLVIYGEQDQTTDYNLQIAPIESFYKGKIKIEKLKDSGHALVWNHAEAVAEVVTHFLESNKIK